MNDIRVYFKKVHTDAIVPSYAHRSDAACDLSAVEDYIIKPSKRILVDTGLQIAIPEGFEAQIRPRSGLAWKKGLTVVNSPGTIDCSYRGNVMVALINLGDEVIAINKGDRVAQMKFSQVFTGRFIETKNLDSTIRGTGGFGSTGIDRGGARWGQGDDV